MAAGDKGYTLPGTHANDVADNGVSQNTALAPNIGPLLNNKKRQNRHAALKTGIFEGMQRMGLITMGLIMLLRLQMFTMQSARTGLQNRYIRGLTTVTVLSKNSL